MSITFKFLLNKRKAPNSDGYPVILRIYKDASAKEHSLKIRLKEHEWDEINQKVQRINPNHEIFNIKIHNAKAKLQKSILIAELGNENEISLDELLNSLNGVKPSNTKSNNYSIIKYGREQIALLTKSGNIGNAIVYTNAVNKLREYANSDNLSFEAFNYNKLTEYNAYLLSCGIKVNTASVYLRTIRAIYNKAVKEDLVSASAYPFKGFKIKNEKTISRALTLPEMRSIVQEDIVVNTPLWHWRNYFLLSFCLIGINFADLLKLTGNNIIDGRVVFRRSKTGKLYSIKLHEKTLDILNYYTNGVMVKDEYLMPILKKGLTPLQIKNSTKQSVKTCNEYLKRIATSCSIDKDISTYYARYTWANIAKQLGYSKDLIAEALGHEYGNRVTGIYLDFYDTGLIDAMSEQVIKAVFKA